MNLQEIGKLVAAARIQAEMTQVDLAHAAGLGRTTISELERGTVSDIGIRKLLVLLDVLNLRLEILPSSMPTLHDLRGANGAVPMRSHYRVAEAQAEYVVKRITSSLAKPSIDKNRKRVYRSRKSVPSK